MLAALKLNDLIFQKDIRVTEIPVWEVIPNPNQPRKNFDRESLNELAESIRQFGVIQPINVRIINGRKYELVSGERRLRAARMAGLSKIPAIVISINDNESAFIALIENIQRKDLNFFEEAEGYFNLINDYGMKQEDIAQMVGKTQSFVANRLRILKLNETCRNLIISNNLTERHARALIKIPDEAVQLKALEKIIEDGYNVKKTDEYIFELLTKMRVQGSQEQKIKRNFNDIRLITNTIKRSLDIMKKSGVDAMYAFEENDSGYEISIKIPCCRNGAF